MHTRSYQVWFAIKTVCCTDRVFRRGCQIRRRGHRLYADDDAEGGEPLGHLREGGHLREVGLAIELPDPEDGRARLYHLEQAPLLELRDWLDDVQQFWTDQLAGLADHLAKEQTP